MRRFLISYCLLVVPAFALDPIPDKLVVLTFDDASKSHIQVAAPLLKKHGFGATFFVTEGFDFPTNRRDYMTWAEIAELHRLGFEIGNHTRDHKPPSSKDRAGTLEQLEAINARCKEHGIPRPVTFSYPGNAIDRDVLPILAEAGIRFARRGGAPEYPYDKGQGFAYEPGLDHPLLIPSAGDARPVWTLDDFKRAVGQARNGKIAVIQLHGVPDTAHSWVNTPRALFESYIQYLADEHFKVIALRDLSRYVDPNVLPSNPLGVIDDRKQMLTKGALIENGRKPKSEADLTTWLDRMNRHGYRAAEVGAAFGMSEAEAAREIASHPIKLGPPSSKLLVLPYPGGRHPRTGFLDGAIRPQRETKVSVFAPWKDGGYAVVDVPEAVWHVTGKQPRKLLYLAHTHVPTIWEEQGLRLPPLEWETVGEGAFEVTRRFPNEVSMKSRVESGADGVRFEFSITNGSRQALSGLDIQMCVMLKGLKGFETLTNDNKVFRSPFAAARDVTGKRWIITAWQGCKRAWGNAPCPCLHSDPRLEDCPPGETRKAKGWVSFYEGDQIQAELDRLERDLKF